jgi:antitoxin component of RelBE/YafQ-DinJ toxin-antitoxin module
MARTAAITTRVEPPVKSAFKALAKEDGRTIAQYVERLLLAHLDEKKRQSAANAKTGKRT